MESRDNQKRKRRRKKNPAEVFLKKMCVLLVSVMVIGLVLGSKAGSTVKQQQVFAASEIAEVSPGDMQMPSGIAGVISALEETPLPGTSIERFGTSCEEVMVGQRIHILESSPKTLDVSSSVQSTLTDLSSKAISMASSPKIMSDLDYDSLLRIVEAEAGTEDLKGRILVANVIMNRVNHPEFPDNIYDVIFEVKAGARQFSPTYRGAIYGVTVTDTTREAVRQALDGVDYSEGALFFVQRSAADEENVNWFDESLEKLFQHGVHEFFKYPEEEN